MVTQSPIVVYGRLLTAWGIRASMVELRVHGSSMF